MLCLTERSGGDTGVCCMVLDANGDKEKIDILKHHLHNCLAKKCCHNLLSRPVLNPPSTEGQGTPQKPV